MDTKCCKPLHSWAVCHSSWPRPPSTALDNDEPVSEETTRSMCSQAPDPKFLTAAVELRKLWVTFSSSVCPQISFNGGLYAMHYDFCLMVQHAIQTLLTTIIGIAEQIYRWKETTSDATTWCQNRQKLKSYTESKTWLSVTTETWSQPLCKN